MGDGHAGRGLVVGERVEVDPGFGLGGGRRAGGGTDDGGVAQERGPGGALGELRGELAEDEVLALLLDEPEDGGVPEGGGPAVAEDHLVAVG